ATTPRTTRSTPACSSATASRPSTRPIRPTPSTAAGAGSPASPAPTPRPSPPSRGDDRSAARGRRPPSGRRPRCVLICATYGIAVMDGPSHTPTMPREVVVVGHGGAIGLELMSACEVLELANLCLAEGGKPPAYRLQVLSLDGGPLPLVAGVEIAATGSLAR